MCQSLVFLRDADLRSEEPVVIITAKKYLVLLTESYEKVDVDDLVAVFKIVFLT